MTPGSPEARKPGSLGLPDHWLTVTTSRKVLVVARTTATLMRLLDVLSLLHNDRRLQVFFTYDDENTALLGSGVTESLRKLNAHILPWREACAARFDLALAASENDRLGELKAPVLLLPHGLGFQKYYPGTRVVAGMDPERLIRGDRVIPAAIALSHEKQRQQLQQQCPEAAPRAVVVGDPCLDHLLASAHQAARYRRLLDAGDRKVVLLASTWGPESLFGRMTDLPQQLLGELPVDEYVLALVLHPGVHAAHSTWQLHSWLADATRSGLILVPPDESWRPVLIAADCVVSDSGSLALYAAALDKPVLLSGRTTTVVKGSPAAEMLSVTSTVDPSKPLRRQIDDAISNHVNGRYHEITHQAVSYPGGSAQRLRELLYGLMDLAHPLAPAEFQPLTGFTPTGPTTAAFVAGTEEDDDLTLCRYPASVDSDIKLGYRHIAAHYDLAGITELDSATILYLSTSDDSKTALRQWPRADLVAASPAPGECLVWTRQGTMFRLTTTANLDPLLLASIVQIRSDQGRRPATTERVKIGQRIIDVRVDSAAQAPADNGMPADDRC